MFSPIVRMMIQSDFHIFQRGLKPPISLLIPPKNMFFSWHSVMATTHPEDGDIDKNRHDDDDDDDDDDGDGDGDGDDDDFEE